MSTPDVRLLVRAMNVYTLSKYRYFADGDQLDLKGVFATPEAAMKRADEYRRPDQAPFSWKKHDSHGVCWTTGVYVIEEYEVETE